MKRVHTPSHGQKEGGHHSTYYCSNMLSVCHRKRDLLNLRRSIHSRKETVHKTTLHPQRPHDDHNKTKQQTVNWWCTKSQVMIRGGKMEKKTTTQKSAGIQTKANSILKRAKSCPGRLWQCCCSPYDNATKHYDVVPSSKSKRRTDSRFPEERSD